MSTIIFNWSLCPSWTNYVAMDQDGEWWAYEEKPSTYTTMFITTEGKSRILFTEPCSTSNWKNTLIERPKQIGQPTPHPHKDLIIAWANGAQIQRKYALTEEWTNASNSPLWSPDTEYRIKPEPVILQYRKYLTVHTYGVDRKTVYRIDIATDPSYHAEKETIFVKWLDDDWTVMEINP